MVDEIELTDEITSARNAREIARIWTTGNSQTALFRGSEWEDPAAWGILLVDVMRHVATIYAAEGKIDYSNAFDRIRSGLEAELKLLSQQGN